MMPTYPPIIGPHNKAALTLPGDAIALLVDGQRVDVIDWFINATWQGFDWFVPDDDEDSCCAIPEASPQLIGKTCSVVFGPLTKTALVTSEQALKVDGTGPRMLRLKWVPTDEADAPVVAYSDCRS